MITTPTVFVLGAGASMAYGYPSGEKLINWIKHETNHKSPLFKELLNLGYSKEFIGGFNKYLSKSKRPSIDAFLEHWPRYMEIGKIGIAGNLIPIEEQSLFKFDDLETKKDWYRYLFAQLNTSFDDFDKNEISFITFNYDRSLEHYLFDALKHSYQEVNDKECAKKLKNIPIVHVYGKLDHLPWEYWQNGNKREYGKSTFGEDLLTSSKGINIIHEDFDDSNFEKTHNLIDNTEKIYFIGLNLLNETNLNRLNILSYFKEEKISRKVCGTAYNMEKSERIRVKRYFGANTAGRDRILLGEKDEDALLFLRRHTIL